MSAVSSRHAIDTLPIKVYCRDGSHITVKLGPLATCSDLHRGLVMKVRGMKEQMVLKDSDPLLRYFAVYTVTSETFLGMFPLPMASLYHVVVSCQPVATESFGVMAVLNLCKIQLTDFFIFMLK